MSHKKIHRFLVNPIGSPAIGDDVTIASEHLAKQINRVLKIQPGESIQVFSDGSDSYTGTIIRAMDTEIVICITDITPAPLIPRTIIAAVSIVKGDAFEMVVQKLTEIGVSTIVPLISGRTIKQSIRLNRLQAISDEAVEQCGGTHRVTITDPLTIKECAEHFPYKAVVLNPVATETGAAELPDTVVCYIGPEGGWNEKDEELLTALNPHHLQITNRVLRTETAAILGVYKLLWQ